jgi:ketosteroid isomerase-like protein
VLGVDRSFLKYSTPDAIMIANKPNRAHDILDPNAVVDPAAPKLFWFPAWVGIARSGDLGVSSGPVEVGGVRRGHYFTVWQKQADGTWKWIYDGGTGSPSKDEPGPDVAPTFLPMSTAAAGSPEKAMAEVRAMEARFAEQARGDQKAAHLTVLSESARLYVGQLPPAKTPAAHESALDANPASFEFDPPLGGSASAAGDLAWTYGAARWTRPDGARSGHYVRVWQKHTDGWKLVFAQLLVTPPPAPPAPTAPAPTAGG